MLIYIIDLNADFFVLLQLFGLIFN